MKGTPAAWLFEQGTRRETMAPNFQLRLFDESADLENVVRFYNETFGPLRPYYSWPITLERFRDKVLSCWEYRREGIWIALHSDRLIGFALGCCRSRALTATDTPRQAAHVSVIGVDPKYQRQGVGRALYEKVEEFARSNGAEMITATCNPMSPMAFFIAPQDDWKASHAFFNAMGLDLKGVDQNLVQSLVGFDLDHAAKQKIKQFEAEGCECRTYEERDYAGLMKLLEHNDWPFWQLDILSKIDKPTETRPFIETCFLGCATGEIYGPDEIGVVVKDGNVLSFCVQTISREKRFAYAGPVMTHPDMENRGLGYVTMQISLRRAAEKGAIMCDVWTGSDGHRSHFYRKCGFQPMLRWPRFEKNLD